MVDLNGHEAGNGGYSQGTPTANRDSSTRREAIYRQLTRMIASNSNQQQLDSDSQGVSVAVCREPKTSSPIKPDALVHTGCTLGDVSAVAAIPR
jgi:hypothetical protein